MPKRRAASRWLSPSTWQAWRTRAYSSTAFILPLPAVRTGRKIRRRLFTPPPRPDTPAASVRDFLSAAYNRAGADEIPMTQEIAAMMMGVRRAGVSVASGILQKAGVVRYAYGRIAVLDRAGLE